MKSFQIHTLMGNTYKFKFNINNTLDNFRKNINETNYSLINKGKVIIYSNDSCDFTVKELIELTDTDIITSDNITFHLTNNFGFPRLRHGKCLIKTETYKDLEMKNDTPSRLLCPLSMETIQYAVKINGRFYDLHYIAEFLAYELNKFISGQIKELICPFRMKIDLENNLGAGLFLHHYNEQLNAFDKASISSVEHFLLIRKDRFTDQQEYDNIIKNYVKLISS